MESNETYVTGLSNIEVEQKLKNGENNHIESNVGKSIKEIIWSNTFTYFNFIFLGITVLLCFVGSFRNLTFLPIVIVNTLIGIYQEIRAKRVLEKMNLLNAPHAVVIRDGQKQKITSENLVKDDVVFFQAGDQVCADAEVLNGGITVNESLLTGEEDAITKDCGATLLSGSFIVSGECYARLTAVGKNSYISKLSLEAKSMKGIEQSEMIRSINRIVKWMGIIIIPIGAILFYQGYYVNVETLKESVVSMVAAVIGMIPEGLYLLTTIALALGTIRLARKKVLLNDMKSIESLARVDVLCVDKTGTITEPKMNVKRIVELPVNQDEDRNLNESVIEYLDFYVSVSTDHNETMEALREYFSKEQLEYDHNEMHALSIHPFSSEKKFGYLTMEHGNYVLGAPEFVLGQRCSLIEEECRPFLSVGQRVLVFAYQKEDIVEGSLSETIMPLALVVISNAVRENAKETFSYFRKEGVEIKVISGDHPETVAEVAKEAGITGAEKWVDATTLQSQEDYCKAVEQFVVFGRVTPKQKQKLVHALQEKGHTVAMTGDGVNDILAMKDADCSVAMASGSEAASQAAQIVLLDSDFSEMPKVVLEGRRVVNNVQRSASLFLVKNIFSLLLAIFSSVMMLTYPMEPSQISLVGMFTIGAPGFLLALEPNRNRIEGHFLKNVLFQALPAGITDAVIIAALAVCGQVFLLPADHIATAATMLLGMVGFMILRKISMPFNRYRLIVFFVNIIGMALCWIILPQLFGITGMSVKTVLLMLVFAFAAESLFRNITAMMGHAESVMSQKSTAEGMHKLKR